MQMHSILSASGRRECAGPVGNGGFGRAALSCRMNGGRGREEGRTRKREMVGKGEHLTFNAQRSTFKL